MFDPDWNPANDRHRSGANVGAGATRILKSRTLKLRLKNPKPETQTKTPQILCGYFEGV